MPAIQLTEEQLSVVHSTAQRLAVVAGAGTGKTHTLAAMARHQPAKRFLYATFSKSAQIDAAGRLPPNVHPRTLNSLAHPTHGKRYRNAGKLGSPVRAGMLAPLFRSSEPGTSLLRARFALEAVKQHCYVANRSVQPSADLVRSAAAAGVAAGQLVADAEILWRQMLDPSDPSVPCLHDAYFKAWVDDGAPGLDRLADHILIDEAQDNNAIADLAFSRAELPLVYVGDPSQAIYGFRGAVDSITAFEADQSVRLTSSHRFGSCIAGIANALLGAFKTDPLKLNGVAGPDSVGLVQRDLPFTVLARTNAGLFTQASLHLDQGFPIAFVGEIEGYALGRLMDLHHLSAGRPDLVSDPVLRALGSFDAVESYAKLTADRELRASVKVVKQFGAELPSLIRRIRRAALCADRGASDKPLVTLCTAHRAKGLEFAQVVMAPDFPTIFFPDGRLVPPAKAAMQEIHLMYVAITRACTILEPTEPLVRLAARSRASTLKELQPVAS